MWISPRRAQWRQPGHHGRKEPCAPAGAQPHSGGIRLFALAGLDATVAVDGRTVTIKRTSEKGARSITVPAESIQGAAVWTGLRTGQFSVHYSDKSHDVTYQSVRFKTADKEWWDAMATAILAAVARTIPATRNRSGDSTPADSATATPPTFDNWLNRTVGYDAEQPAAADAKPL